MALPELRHTRDYYRRPETQAERKKLGLPQHATDVEIEVFAQTWSEHCKHKIFAANIAFTGAEGKTEQINSLYKTYIKRATKEIDDLYAQFRISEALMATYKLTWDDLCSWYLESIKPPFIKNADGEGVAGPMDRKTYDAAIGVFEDVMKLLHPFMPFLTEELWSHLNERKGPQDALIIAPWPKSGKGDTKLEAEGQHAFDLVTAVGKTRN